MLHLIRFASRKPHVRVAIGWMLGGLLLIWAANQVQGEHVGELLGSWRWPEFLLAAALVPLQINLAARRWETTATRLGVGLGSGVAYGEYYFSTLVNQVLPGGVAGDMIRVYRHGRQAKGTKPIYGAIRAAMIERSLGAFMCSLFSLVALFVWPIVTSHERPRGLLFLVIMLCCLFLVCSAWPENRTIFAKLRFMSRLGVDLRYCIWHKEVRRKQFSASFLLSLSLVLGFGLVALALEPLPNSSDFERGTVGVGVLGLIAYPLIFLAMTIPVSPGAWGLREATATALLPQLGTTPEFALAISIAYGLAVLLGSLPGIFWIYRNSYSHLWSTPLVGSRELKVWISLATLNVLLLLPRILGNIEGFEVVIRISANNPSIFEGLQSLTRISQEHLFRWFGDFFLVAVVLMVCSRLFKSSQIDRVLRWTTCFVFVSTLLYEVNLVVGTLLMNQEPLFYDEYFLLTHLFVLLNDLVTPRLIFGLLVAIAIIFCAIYFGCGAIQSLGQYAEDLGWRSVIVAVLVTGYLVIGTLFSGPGNRSSVALWTSIGVLNNIQDSRVAWKRVHRRITRSPYAEYNEHELKERPNIALYVIESYGRIVAEHKRLVKQWKQLLQNAEPELERAGWLMRSGYSTAPVSGGRSWLADGSVFFGHSIRYEAEYRHLLKNVHRIPNLIGYLQNQGYHTLRLAPSDRARPGIRNFNDWGFDSMITYDEIAYTGPRVGWGIVPDQYSLGKLHDEILPGIASPRFTYFHLVSAHAPWKEIPEQVSDWRDIVQNWQEEDAHVWADSSVDASVKQAAGQRLAFRGAKRFRRMEKPRFPYAGYLNPTRAQRYSEAISYELSILIEALCDVESADIVIIMGDHQPPLLNRYTKNFDVPVHVLARDKKWLKQFKKEGYVRGMVPTLKKSRRDRRGRLKNKAGVTHEEIFPILVKSLQISGFSSTKSGGT